jgi:hypothetical protein
MNSSLLTPQVKKKSLLTNMHIQSESFLFVSQM